MREGAKETIIIVHGTWATPKPGKTSWYQRIDDTSSTEGFVCKLDAALNERGSQARCWAHCSRSSQTFYWSGDNSWIARSHAASELVDYVVKLGGEGWRCHLVAHSHGGNVVIEALARITELQDSTRSLGRVVTLGTPFIDAMSPILRRTSRQAKRINSISWAVFTLFPLLAFLILSLIGALGETVGLPGPGAASAYAAAILIFLWVAVSWWRRYAEQGKLSAARRNQAARPPPPFLAIGSDVDEAWQVLHHMRSMENPLASRSNLAKYLFSSLRAQRRLRVEVARAHGAKSYGDLAIGGRVMMALIHVFSIFAVAVGTLLLLVMRQGAMFLVAPGYEIAVNPAEYIIYFGFSLLTSAAIVFVFVLVLVRPFGERFFSAFLSPFRFLGSCVGSLIDIPGALATYVLRHKSWSVLLSMAMGLEGYRFAMPTVEQSPSSLSGNSAIYENMPLGAKTRALDNRSSWIARHLGDVSQSFSKLAITAADLTLLLRQVEQDQTLVHGAYYTDDECIARIADWIAGRG